MRQKIKNILVIVGWSIIIALLTVETAYEAPPYAWDRTHWAPSFSIVDYGILLATSVMVGVLLADLEMIFWGWIGSSSLSFLISVTYSSLYNWFVLEWGEVFSDTPWGWEAVAYQTATALFRIIFPCLVLLFVSSFLGGIVGERTGISRKISAAFSLQARARTKD